MRILHISYRDSLEGAAIAAQRICEAQRQEGYDSVMLVLDKKSNYSYISQLPSNRLEKMKTYIKIRIDLLVNKIAAKKNEFISISNIGNNITRNRAFIDADIIHLHWINRGYLSINNLIKICETKNNVLWTCHDYWAVTGGCHNFQNCTKYATDCDNCPKIHFSHILRKRHIKKGSLLSSNNLFFSTPTDHVSRKIILNPYLSANKVFNLPNTVDCKIFFELDKKKEKEYFDLLSKKLVILLYNDSNPLKGVHYIKKALKCLNNDIKNKTIIATFGEDGFELENESSVRIQNFGRINDQSLLAKLFNAADVYVSASEEETFGQTIVEAMACGVPCVAFDNSGPKEIIDHYKNGYLAKHRDTEDLAKGISICLENRENMSRSAIKKVTQNYSYEAVAKQSIDIYQQILNRNRDEKDV